MVGWFENPQRTAWSLGVLFVIHGASLANIAL